jgi:two-component system, sensor histidine kinase and response regulator
MTTLALATNDLPGTTAERAAERYKQLLRAGHCRIDYLFAFLLLLEWSGAVAFALLVSPDTWVGDAVSLHANVWAAIVLGGEIVGLPIVLALTLPGRAVTRHVIAIGQMLMSALLIHLSAGRIEAHFHVFGSLAFLALYRDWKVMISASLVVAADHFLRGVFWPMSVFGSLTVSPWRWAEHSAWVVFEDVVLIHGGFQSLRELRELASRQAEIEIANATMEQEVQDRTAQLRLANAELTRQAGELLESKNLMASIVETAPDAILTIDHGGRVTEFNPAAEAMFGYAKRDSVGKHLEELIAQLSRYDTLNELFTSNAVPFVRCSQEAAAVRSDGTEFPAELTITSVERAGLSPLYVGFLRDLTSRKLAEETLRQAAETAQAASRAKSEFLANMSHEIRTPMNGVIGMTELALDTDLTPRQREYLGLVKSSADSLLTVINDILDFSKIEAGKLSLDPTPFALRNALDETLQALAMRAHAKGLELACRIAPEVPDAVIGDLGRLRQVVVNLVGNAIKFTERGEVVASVSLEASGDETVQLKVAVADTGIGISVQNMRAIFRPFEQADGSTTRRFGGTGLGLTISSKLVELMGGQISVQSEIGVGSTFWFTVKLGLQSQNGSGCGDIEVPLLEGLPVLIVDDNATNRLILEEVVRSWGARPTAVDCGPAALEELQRAVPRHEPFPIVLVDGMMPGMDGLDLAGLIRATPAIADVRILLLTSAGHPEDTTRCRALDISACLTKPVRQSELFDALMKGMSFWNRAERVRPLRHAADDRISPLPELEHLHILLAEDHPVNQKVAVRMLQHQGHSVAVVADGRQALAELDAGEFDVVLMDLQMPEMDGFEALRAIRDRETHTGRHVTVIALTAHAMQGDRERCLEAGFDGYLPKPIRQADLHKALEALARGSDSDGKDPNQSIIMGLSEICGGDDDFARELAEMFLESAPRTIADIETALESGDLHALTNQAHALSGISRTIGAKNLAGVAAQLEAAGRASSLTAAVKLGPGLVAAWEQARSALEQLLPVEIQK